jgi:hypothetical protein
MISVPSFPFFAAVTLLLFQCLVPVAYSQTTRIADATSNYVPSSESTFDHMIELEDNLWFHWNDIMGDRGFMGRLIHTADSFEQAPSWLGFGLYHSNHNYTKLPAASDPFMIGSTAIIGMVTAAEAPTPAQHYHLAAQSSEGIRVASDDTSYSNANVIQHDRDDGKVVTDLSFTKALEGAGSIGANLRREGQNIFLWAVGPPEGKNSGALGKHSMKGVIFLDLETVQEEVEGPSSPAYTAARGDSEETSSNAAPIISGKCGESSVLDGTDAGQVDLTPTLQFHWKLVGRGTKIQIALAYTGEDAWLGVATSTNGKMVGSSAVIGAVDGTDNLGIPPTHYNLNDQDPTGVVADASVLLEDATITSASSSGDASKTTTILQFTRMLNDPNDAIPITAGLTTFLYAVGASRELAYHEHRGAFQINLEDCGGTIVAVGTWTRHGLFAFHGFLATMAWALASPFAVTVAWFRNLVPASWIYIHVFANVFTFLATLVAFIVVIIGITKEDAADHFSKAHHWVGLILMLLATFQVINGFLRPPVQRKDTNQTTAQDTILGIIPIPRTPRETWQLMHRLSGLLAIVLGIYQVQSGLGLYALQFQTTSVVMFYWIYVGLFISGIVGLKVWVHREEEKARQGVMQAVSTSEPHGGIDDAHVDGDDEEDSPHPETELSSSSMPPTVLQGTLS